MPGPVVVTDPADPRLADFRDLVAGDRRPSNARGTGPVIVEGAPAVRRLLASPYRGTPSSASRPGMPRTVRTHRRAVRVSMGHVLALPFAVLADWPSGLERLHAAGYRTVALTPAADAADLAEVLAAHSGRDSA